MNKMLEDVRKGLSARQKHLSSKYFYDDAGSRIFQEIMQMPEYYLTNTEHDILSSQSREIMAAVGYQEPFNIIELGAGDGAKTVELLRYCVEAGLPITYTPVDISEEVTHELALRLNKELPGLKVEPLVGDYFHVLEEIEKEQKPHLFLFLGSNIGNYLPEDAAELISLFSSHMHPGDKILIGFDLMKNPQVIADAYNDRAGITRRFNLNLLKRLNREIGANFNLEKFDFYSHYDPEKGAVKSYLVSLEDQDVVIDQLSELFHLEKDELIYTELSRKFNFQSIAELGASADLNVQQHFTDDRTFFADTLFIK